MSERPDRRSQGDERRRDLEARVRQAFLEGAEQHSRDALGHGLTHDELLRIIRHFPAAVGDR